MSVKKTISLQEYVVEVAEKNAKIMCNGNLSNYINSLIYNSNREEIELKAKEKELNKPKRCGVIFAAQKSSTCEYCGKQIKPRSKICNGEFLDGHQSYVHQRCCRET